MSFFERLRWTNNLEVVLLNTVVLRLVFPTAAIGMALAAHQNGWGILNTVTIPTPIAIALAVVILDFAIYLQHVLVHAVLVL